MDNVPTAEGDLRSVGDYLLPGLVSETGVLTVKPTFSRRLNFSLVSQVI